MSQGPLAALASESAFAPESAVPELDPELLDPEPEPELPLDPEPLGAELSRELDPEVDPEPDPKFEPELPAKAESPGPPLEPELPSTTDPETLPLPGKLASGEEFVVLSPLEPQAQSAVVAVTTATSGSPITGTCGRP